MLFKLPPTTPKEYLTQRHGGHKEKKFTVFPTPLQMYLIRSKEEISRLNKKINKRWVWLGLVYFAALCETKRKLKMGVVGLSVLCGFV
jgi:hypothetical protein